MQARAVLKHGIHARLLRGQPSSQPSAKPVHKRHKIVLAGHCNISFLPAIASHKNKDGLPNPDKRDFLKFWICKKRLQKTAAKRLKMDGAA